MAWLISDSPELRAAALDDLLRFETIEADHYRNILDRIASSRPSRIEEIDEAERRRKEYLRSDDDVQKYFFAESIRILRRVPLNKAQSRRDWIHGAAITAMFRQR